MAGWPLLKEQIDQGAALVRKLVASDHGPEVAYWSWDSDSESWKLYLRIPEFDDDGPRRAYQVVHAALNDPAFSEVELPDIVMVTSWRDRSAVAVRGFRAKYPDHPARTMRNTMIDRTFFEGVYIYPTQPSGPALAAVDPSLDGPGG